MNNQDSRVPKEPVSQRTDEVARAVVDAAFRVHSKLGPGLLESVYEVCMEYEMKKRGLEVKRQIVLPVVYDEVRLDAGLRLDMLVDGRVIVELKAVEQMVPVFEAQLLTYLKLTNHRLGFLINFNVAVIKDGIKRMVL